MTPLASVAARLVSNMARRAARLEAAGIKTTALKDFRVLQGEIRGGLTSAREALPTLKKLDASPGLRATTARAVQSRELRASRLATIEKQVLSRVAAKTVPRDSLEFYVRALRNRLRGRVRNLRKLGLSDIHAVDRIESILGEIVQKGGVPKISDRTLRRIAAQLTDASRWRGLTVSGAREERNRLGEFFGESSLDWTREERTAVWDALRREYELNSARYTSDQVFRAVGQSNAKVNFSMSADGKLVADLGVTMDSAVSKGHLERANAEIISNILDRSSGL